MFKKIKLWDNGVKWELTIISLRYGTGPTNHVTRTETITENNNSYYETYIWLLPARQVGSSLCFLEQTFYIKVK